jgi:LPXTG-motif cell wall-anchored protein
LHLSPLLNAAAGERRTPRAQLADGPLEKEALMKKSIPFALGLVVALVCAVAVAQTAVVMANGKVITTSPSALVIETPTGERLNFVVDAQSVVPTGIVIGNPVAVDYTRLDDGSLHVSKVTLVETPSGQAALVQETEAIPAPAPVTEPAPVEPAPVADTDPYDADEEALPQTASPLALLALAGFTALGGSGLVRWARKR